MATENKIAAITKVEIPRRLFLFCLAVGLLTPFIARLPGIPLRGWGWFADYLPAILFMSVINLITTGAWYAAGKAGRRRRRVKSLS